MKRRWLGALLGTSLLIAPATAQSPTGVTADAVDTFIRAEIEKRQIPGLAVAVIRDGQVRKLATYGSSSVELGTPVTVDTVFNVASVSKAFTGVAVMRLVEDGVLALDDPIGRHLDQLPAGWRVVTVRRLLNHTSGLPVIDASPYSMETLAQSVPAALSLLASRSMESVTGTKWTYNSTNYMLLGMLIEKLSGKTFTEFCAERLFKPAGLQAATFGDSRAVVTNRATVYTRFRYDSDPPQLIERLNVLAYETPPFNYPAGGLNLTIADFTKWVLALQQGKLISRQNLEELWRPAIFGDGTAYSGPGQSWTSYGLGWTLNLRPMHPLVGGTGGLRARFAIYPNDNLSIIVLTNLQAAGPDSLGDGIAALYLK